MKTKTVLSAILALSGAGVAYGAPTVTGQVISWPNDGWYQVQAADTYKQVCGGGRSCSVDPGTYIVINHSTGERFNNIKVSGNSGGGEPAVSAVTVNGKVISWPNDGWYQVQTADTYQQVCAGGLSCTVEPGTYTVINHSTGKRFSNIKVSGESGGGEPAVSAVTVNGNVISWPNDGWYQVQSADTYQQVCAGGRSCQVASGTYIVINHSTGQRFSNIKVGGDPVAQNTTVYFDITVPAYQSNALQVKLAWDNKLLSANWVGDELWSASGDFPANTQHPLTVTFYDRNGDITLGSFEKAFKTGTNASESYEITADQFDTNRWDSDSDGVSNIDELIAGTDPLVNESVELEVRTTVPAALDEISTASGFYEYRIPAELPFSEHTEFYQPLTLDPYQAEINSVVTIDIDASGTGSLSETYRSFEPSNSHIENKMATRTNTGNGIVWTGTYKRSDSSAGNGEDFAFSIKTQVLDEQTRTQEGEFDMSTFGYGSARPTSHVSYTLTGKSINDSTRCESAYGTITYDGLFYEQTTDMLIKSTTMITKAMNDQYWLVNEESLSGEILDQYLIESIKTTFYCDFSE